MSDLVKRLRGWIDDETIAPDELDRTIAEAADRIEKLDAALREISDFPYIGEKAAQQMALIARAARAPEMEQK